MKTLLFLDLDTQDQLRKAHQANNELILTLAKDAATVLPPWHPTPDHPIQALLMDGNHLRIKLAASSIRYSIARIQPKTLCITLEDTRSFLHKSSALLHKNDLGEPLAFMPMPKDRSPKLSIATHDTRTWEENGLVIDTEAMDLRKSLRGIERLPFSQMERLFPASKAPKTEREDHSFATCLERLWSSWLSFFVTPAYAEQNDRALSIRPQDIRAKINAKGPENWPEDDGLATSLEAKEKPSPQAAPFHPASPQSQDIQSKPVSPNPAIEKPNQPQAPQSQSAFPKNSIPQIRDEETPYDMYPKATTPNVKEEPNTAQPKEKDPKKPAQASQKSFPVREKASQEYEGLVPDKPKEEEESKPREVIYVDENGNPVEKPLNLEAIFKEAEELMEQQKFADALVVWRRLLDTGELDAQAHEKVLYAISDCYWGTYEREPLAGFEDVVSTTLAALNFNLRSEHVPDALLRLGVIHEKVGNLDEAEGYVLALMRRYPTFPGTAQGLTAVANAFLQRKKYEKAESYFTYILDKFPESPQLKNASIGLIKVYYAQDKFDRARLILDFLNKRWPRHYLDDPDFLFLQAKLENHYRLYDRQAQTQWLFYNLVPRTPHTIPMFLELGDLYLKANNPKAASFLYQEILQRDPESEEAITARIRLAEQGFYLSPIKASAMFALFGRGANPPFWEVYQEAASRSKTNPEAIAARLKYALWLLWDKQYPEAMAKAAEFIDEYPDYPDKVVAEDIIWESFSQGLSLAFTEQNYVRICRLWNAFPLVRKRYGKPDAKLRFALAMGQKELGDIEGSIRLFQTFLQSSMDPTYGEKAFLELFNLNLSQSNWNAILDLGKAVADWKLKPEIRQDLTYAMALSAQNLHLPGTALGLWRTIANDPTVQTYQKAWAMVFLAQDAERRKDIRQSYNYNMQIIDLFTQLQEQRSDKADPERIKNAMISLMDICEVANRLPEALQWVNRFHTFAPNDTKEYPAMRYREARIYRKLGDSNRAQALLEEIVKNFPDSPYAEAAKTELETFEISRDLQNFRADESAK